MRKDSPRRGHSMTGELMKIGSLLSLIVISVSLGCSTDHPVGLTLSSQMTDGGGGTIGRVRCGIRVGKDGGVVGPEWPQVYCSTAAGEHCCDDEGFACQSLTTSCSTSRFDCDGPEDCGGSLCCVFRNGDTNWRSRCGTSCDNGTAFCHSDADCPTSTVCCGNFGVGPIVGVCVTNCDCAGSPAVACF